MVRYADISLNSEPVVLRALSQEAQRRGKTHQVLLMVDMGDLREGIWFGEYQRILETVTLITGLPGLELYGLGTNFNCYGTVLPTVKNGEDFLALAAGWKPTAVFLSGGFLRETAPAITCWIKVSGRRG